MDFTKETQDAILAAVHQGVNGNITKDELLDQLIETTHGEFKDDTDEADAPWSAFEFFVAVDENGVVGTGRDGESAREDLCDSTEGDCMDVYCITGKVHRAQKRTVDVGEIEQKQEMPVAIKVA
jgi:hypothetical protein